DSAAWDVEEARAGENNAESLGTRDGHVQPVHAKQELNITRELFAARSRHRDEAHGGLLALELVDSSDACLRRQKPFQQIDLSIVGRDDQNVRLPNLSRFAVTISKPLTQEAMT